MLPLPYDDNLRCKTFPLATMILLVLNVLAFVCQMVAAANGDTAWFTTTFALIPGNVTNAFLSADPRAMALGVMSIFTAMFMHGGLSHIAGNMLFLFVFGRGLESRMGMNKFIGFYLVCGLFAFLLQMFSDPMSMVPNVGASGAIAGVLSGYLVYFPKSKVRGIILVPLPLFVTMSGFWFLIFWIYSQFQAVLPLLLNGTMSSSGGGVAYWAHIGGFMGGLLLGFAAKWLNPNNEECYVPTNCAPCDEDHVSSDEAGQKKQ